VDGQLKIPNLVPRRIRELDRQETRAEFADAMARKAIELGESVSPSARYVARLEDGDVRCPHPAYRRVLSALCGHPSSELGFTPENSQCSVASPFNSPESRASVAVPRNHDSLPGVAVPVRRPPGSLNDIFAMQRLVIEAPEWPIWFGMRIARLIALIDNWQNSGERLDSLQTILHQEILMFDASRPDSDNAYLAEYAISRRQALITLAALPATFTPSHAFSPEADITAAARQFFLSQCAASLTACWHLLRGSDLSSIDQILSAYLLPLEGIAHQRSRDQQAAARLASQAHRISGIIALHRHRLKVREQHCKRALFFATVASDAGSQASALISLASTYFYNSDPAQAAVMYEQASALEASMPPLQRSRVYAELSVVYGQLSREHDAIRSARLAEEIYPDQPEQDPSFLYAEFTPASLTLEQGLAYIALAERYPGRRFQNKAAEIFARFDQTVSAVPERIRFEIINHQASTAVLLDDIDAYEMYVHRGLEGVALLGSRQRQKEMELASQRAMARWPYERRVRALSKQLQLASGTSDEEQT
jgi:tetratricopeptide (TPR) repeat protein